MTTKKPTYEQLLRKNLELAGQLAGTYKRVSRDIPKASTAHFLASGVVLQLTALGGRELIEPVVIRDGLSLETVEAIRADLLRSFELAIQ